MIPVLFVTQTIGNDANSPAQCGVGIHGTLVLSILKRATRCNFIPCYADNDETIITAIERYHPQVVIYNYGASTGWIEITALTAKYPNLPQVLIHYDLDQSRIDRFMARKYFGFKYLLSDNDTLAGNQHVYIVARALPADGMFINQIVNPVINPIDPIAEPDHIPKIGFQGFGFVRKGLDHLAQVVNDQFDRAILRLHIPFAHFGDRDGTLARQRVDEVRRIITKPGIQIEVSHDFMDDVTIVSWLHENDVNCYCYRDSYCCGIASSLDYAIAAGKPIAITRSHMLKNLWDLTPSIEINNPFTLPQIIANGIRPIQHLYNRYSNQRMIQDYEAMCIDLVAKSEVNAVDVYPYRGQLRQDEFVARISGFKQYGTYLDLGLDQPMAQSRTHLLDVDLKWRGLLVSPNQAELDEYQCVRPRSMTYRCSDRWDISDLINQMKTGRYPPRIDYLSVNVPVEQGYAINVLSQLDKGIFGKYRFGVITFKHDNYLGNYHNTQRLSRQMIANHGYILVFADVSLTWEGRHMFFEDWYLDCDLVQSNIIHNLCHVVNNVDGLNYRDAVEITGDAVLTHGHQSVQ